MYAALAAANIGVNTFEILGVRALGVKANNEERGTRLILGSLCSTSVIRHTLCRPSAYVSLRRHTSAYVSL